MNKPRRCKTKQITNTVRIIFILALAVLNTSLLRAAPPPGDAGSLLENIKPAPVPSPEDIDIIPKKKAGPIYELDDKHKISVTSIRITGLTIFSEANLLELLGDAAERELTLAGLQAYADRITQHYRDAGYLLAHAYLPPQEIRNGIVEIAVLEGRLGKLSIDNRSALTDTQVNGRLSGIKQSEVLVGSTLERSMLLLQDLPGVDPNVILRPGDSVGTCNLDLRLDPTPSYSGQVDLDNYGNTYTGQMRLGASVTAGNLTGWLDTLNLRALASEELAYGRFAWQMPVGASGTQAGTAGSYMYYRLGEDFKDLDAYGTDAIGNLYLQHPIIRSRGRNLRVQLLYEHRRLVDEVDATDTQTRKRLNAITLDLSFDRLDGLFSGGINQGSLQ